MSLDMCTCWTLTFSRFVPSSDAEKSSHALPTRRNAVAHGRKGDVAGSGCGRRQDDSSGSLLSQPGQRTGVILAADVVCFLGCFLPYWSCPSIGGSLLEPLLRVVAYSACIGVASRLKGVFSYLVGISKFGLRLVGFRSNSSIYLGF